MVNLDMHILLCTGPILSYFPAIVFYSPLLKRKVKNYELQLQIYQIFHAVSITPFSIDNNFLLESISTSLDVVF